MIYSQTMRILSLLCASLLSINAHGNSSLHEIVTNGGRRIDDSSSSSYASVSSSNSFERNLVRRKIKRGIQREMNVHDSSSSSSRGEGGGKKYRMRSSSAHHHPSSDVLPERRTDNSTPDLSTPFKITEFSYQSIPNQANHKRNHRRRPIVVNNEAGSDGGASNPRSNRRGQEQASGKSKGTTHKGGKNNDNHSSKISTKVPKSTKAPHSNGYSTKAPKSYKTPKALKKEKQVHFHAKRAAVGGRQSFGKGEGGISSAIAMYQVREHFEKCEQRCRKRRRPLLGHGNGKGSHVSPSLASGKKEKDRHEGNQYHGSSRDFVVFDPPDTGVSAVATEGTGVRTGAILKPFEDKDVPSGSYRSMGGKGGKGHSHQTQSNAQVPSEGINECCIGGVSFLKFRLHGIGTETETGNGSTGGNLTVGSQRSSARHTSTNTTGKGGGGNSKMVIAANGKGSISTMQGDSVQSVVFVDCHHPCLDATVSKNANCRITSANVTNNIDVKEGDEICIAVWNSKIREIEMGSSLPMVVLLTLGSLKTEISTSCTSPIYPPYAQYLTVQSEDNDDENVWIPFHNEENEELDHKPKIIYLDGFSPGWVYFSQNMAKFHNIIYDYSFAACGCACSDAESSSSAPSVSPQTESNPSQTPTIDTQSPIVVLSSSHPSPSELGLQIPVALPRPTQSPSFQSNVCLEACESWIQSNCVLLAEERGKCSKTSEGGRVLSTKFVASASSSREEFEHHKRMVLAMKNLLQYLE